MKVSFGLKPHSGWAALVVLGTEGGDPRVFERTRIELVEQGEAHWAKQPYHAAEGKKPGEARRIVERGIISARAIAVDEIRAAEARARDAGHEVAACAVLMAEPMPDWNVDEILAVHFRMHKAEVSGRIGASRRGMWIEARGDSGEDASRVRTSGARNARDEIAREHREAPEGGRAAVGKGSEGCSARRDGGALARSKGKGQRANVRWM